jgi:hypothetical protein
LTTCSRADAGAWLNYPFLTQKKRDNETGLDFFEARYSRAVPGIKGVNRVLDCRAYKSGTMLEANVEAELKDGNAVCWWLDVSWKQEEWHIEPSVLVTDDESQRVLRDFTEKRPKTIDDFTVDLKEATCDLVAYARSMDLSPLVFDSAEVSHQ